MRSFDKASIVAAINENEAVLAIERAFRDHSNGQVHSFPSGHLRFDRPPGDFHVKGAHITGRPYFTIKMASSFFDNPKRGLPSSNGLMLVFNAESGEPVATLLDEGLLTDLRTAIAGSIAARLIAPPSARRIGIVGAGTQGAMQARWVSRRLGSTEIGIWARDAARAEALAVSLRGEGKEAQAVSDLNTLCAQSDVIVTTTPSRTPLLGMEQLRPGCAWSRSVRMPQASENCRSILSRRPMSGSSIPALSAWPMGTARESLTPHGSSRSAKRSHAAPRWRSPLSPSPSRT